MINVPVRTFAEEIQVELTQGGRESVRVLDDLRLPWRPGHAQRVAALARRHRRFKKPAFVNAPHGCDFAAVSRDQLYARRSGLQCSHDPASGRLLQTEDRKGVVVPAIDQCLVLFCLTHGLYKEY